MKATARVMVFFGALFLAAEAYAQTSPPQAPPEAPPAATPPPPQATPPPPPPQPPPPPPPYYGPPVYYQEPQYYRPPPPPQWDGKTRFTLRAEGGVAFVGTGYYCGYLYTYYIPAFSCGGGYATAQPDVDVDVDIWFVPSMGITLGANVMWGSYTPALAGVPPLSIYSTTWEPHADVLLAPGYGDEVAKGRVRLGFGIYITSLNGQNTTGQTLQFNGVGAAMRLGFGVSLFPKALVGLGMDALFEAGWIGSNYVSTVQLLLGPELHFAL